MIDPMDISCLIKHYSKEYIKQRMPKFQILTGILYNQEVLKHVIIACVSNGPRGYMYIIHAAVSL